MQASGMKGDSDLQNNSRLGTILPISQYLQGLS